MMHESTFQYLKPTDEQLNTMNILQGHTTDYAAQLQLFLPEGPDKTYILRKLREVAMWINVAITRNTDDEIPL
jgi:hypothetical protein